MFYFCRIQVEENESHEKIEQIFVPTQKLEVEKLEKKRSKEIENDDDFQRKKKKVQGWNSESLHAWNQPNKTRMIETKWI